MSEFKYKKVTKWALAGRKLVRGVGINDSPYLTTYFHPVTGKQTTCPYYTRWCAMLQRCYSHKYQAKYSTYIGYSVDPDWLLFSTFKLWMEKQPWQGNQLDKDIIDGQLKYYSPDTCRFIPPELNSLLGAKVATRGQYPQGVCLHKPTGKYMASCRVNGKPNSLGYYHTVNESRAAYLEFKIKQIQKHQLISNDIAIIKGLGLIICDMIMEIKAIK